MHAYINRPNPHITIHCDASCGQIYLHRKNEQRHIVVRSSNLITILDDFIHDKYELKSGRLNNDLWLDIVLESPEQEIGLVHIIHGIISQKHHPFALAPINIHCK